MRGREVASTQTLGEVCYRLCSRLPWNCDSSSGSTKVVGMMLKCFIPCGLYKEGMKGYKVINREREEE